MTRTPSTLTLALALLTLGTACNDIGLGVLGQPAAAEADLGGEAPADGEEACADLEEELDACWEEGEEEACDDLEEELDDCEDEDENEDDDYDDDEDEDDEDEDDEDEDDEDDCDD